MNDNALRVIGYLVKSHVRWNYKLASSLDNQILKSMML